MRCCGRTREWEFGIPCHLWDGKNPATTEETAHHTMEEAIGYLHTLSEKYPNRDDITIIICDV